MPHTLSEDKQPLIVADGSAEFRSTVKKALKYVIRGELKKFSKLLKDHPALADVKFFDGKTLFIIACEYLKNDIIEVLLKQEKDDYLESQGEDKSYPDFYLKQTTKQGNNGIMYLCLRNSDRDDNKKGARLDHDAKALETLQRIYNIRSNLTENGFTNRDNNGSTPLMVSLRSMLPGVTQYLCAVFFEAGEDVLLKELFDENKNRDNAISVARSNGGVNNLMDILATICDTKIYSKGPVEQVNLLAAVAAKMEEEQVVKKRLLGPPEGKERLEYLIRKYLANVTEQQEFNKLGDVFFEKKLGAGLIESLYVVTGLPLTKAREAFVNSKDEQKILEIIRASQSIPPNDKRIMQGDKSEVSAAPEVQLDLALKRFCSLVARGDSVKGNDLLSFINTMQAKCPDYKLEYKLRTYVTDECNFYQDKEPTKVLQEYRDYIRKVPQEHKGIKDIMDNTLQTLEISDKGLVGLLAVLKKLPKISDRVPPVDEDSSKRTWRGKIAKKRLITK